MNLHAARRHVPAPVGYDGLAIGAFTPPSGLLTGRRSSNSFRAALVTLPNLRSSYFSSILGGWGSTTRRGPGASSRRRSPGAVVATGAPRVRRRGTPAVTARRGAGDASRSRASVERRAGSVPYAELHCHSNFSFLDGSSHPEELVEEAASLASKPWRSPITTGSTASSASPKRPEPWASPPCSAPRSRSPPASIPMPAWPATRSRHAVPGQHRPGSRLAQAPDPHGAHLVVLADGPDGYARVARTLSLGHLAGEKGAPQFSFADVADTIAGHAWVLTGCRKGSVPAALVADGPTAAARRADTARRGVRA